MDPEKAQKLKELLAEADGLYEQFIGRMVLTDKAARQAGVTFKAQPARPKAPTTSDLLDGVSASIRRNGGVTCL